MMRNARPRIIGTCLALLLAVLVQVLILPTSSAAFAPVPAVPAWNAESNLSSSGFGRSLTTMDINSDGYDDLVVGAPDYTNGEANEGAVFIYYGSAQGLAATPGWTYESNSVGARLGASVANLGLVNADAFQDLIVGAPGYSALIGEGGAAFVFHGGPTGPAAFPDWSYTFNFGGSNFGNSVAGAGDVNGDGFADAIVGAYRYTNGEAEEGAVFLFAGDAPGLLPNHIWTNESNQVGAHMGVSVGSAGNVNGDPFGDFIVGADLYDLGVSDQGGVFVFLGASSAISPTPYWSATGFQTGGGFGSSVTALDFNGDGFTDIAVGVPNYTDTATGEGAVFLYYNFAGTLDPGLSGWILGGQAGIALGASVANAGDIDGDGIQDLIAGAPFYSGGSTTGAAFAYLGSPLGLATIPSFMSDVGLSSDNLGAAVAGGDFDGNLFDDLAVGAPHFTNGEPLEGRVAVNYASAPPTLDPIPPQAVNEGALLSFAVTATDPDLTTPTAVVFNAPANSNFDGTTFSFTPDVYQAGTYFIDFGATDGFLTSYFTAEVTVGNVDAPPVFNPVGEQFVAIGQPMFFYVSAADPDGNSVSLSTSELPPSAVFNGSAFMWTPGFLDAGDYVVTFSAFDGALTSTMEVTIHAVMNTAPVLSPIGPKRISENGLLEFTVSAYDAESDQLLYSLLPPPIEGNPNGPAAANATLDPITGLFSWPTFTGDAGNYSFVFMVCDTNLTMPLCDSETVAITIFSEPSPVPGDIFEVNKGNSWSGYSVAGKGDVNGDGHDDLLVGSYYFDAPENDAGRVSLYLGALANPSGTASWTFETHQVNSHLGTVAFAGDVNGDGYGDLIVGADGFDYQGRADEGAAFLFYGGPSGPAISPDQLLEAGQAGANFGCSITRLGDFDGDGFDDVAIGAKNYTGGLFRSGAVFIYKGSPAGLVFWQILEGGQANEGFGFSVAGGGDISADLVPDLVVGSLRLDGEFIDEGAANVFYGSWTGFPAISDAVLTGGQAYGQYSYSVAIDGDANGDLVSDLLVGARTYDNGQTNEGRVDLYLGALGGVSTTPSWTAESDQSYAYLGSSVAFAGDTTNSGHDNILVGVPAWDGGQADEGAAFLYLGGVAIATIPDLVIESNQPGAYLGYSLAGVGRRNGDAFSDYIVGAPLYDKGEVDEGATFYFYGSNPLANALTPASDPISPQVVAEGDPLSLPIHFFDDNGDYFTVSVSGLPTGASFNFVQQFANLPFGANHMIYSLDWTPDFLQAGEYDVTVTVDDGTGFSNQTFHISVTNTNHAPTISGVPPATTLQGSFFSFTPTASDADTDDTLTFSYAGLPGWLSFDPATGTISGTPGNQHVFPWTGITITVSDGQGGSAQLGPFDLEVLNVNDAPTISGIPPATVAQDATYSFSPVGDDIDGDVLTFSLINNPAWLTVNPTFGTIGGFPINADVGTASGVILRATDPGGLFAELTFSITVTNVNDAPTISGSPSPTVAQGTPYLFTPAASDIDVGDTVTFSATGVPTWLSFSTATGTLSGTPANADVGTFSGITVTVTDAGGLSATLGSLDITVTNVNDAPTISGIPPATVAQDSAYAFTPTASDIDTGDTLTFSLTGNPAWLTVNPATGALSGTPANADVATTGVINLRVTDAAGLFAELTFSVTVTNVNDAPTISGTPTPSATQGAAYSFTPTVGDIDTGDTLTFTSSGVPAWLSFSTATGTISGTPANADVGAAGPTTITVTDAGGLSANLGPFSITVANVNDAPTISGIPAATVAEDSAYAFTPTANDIDTGDTLTFSLTGNPAWLTVNTATGALSGTPVNADVATTSGIKLRVTDAAGLFAELTFSLAVTNVNDAPTISGVPTATVAQNAAYSFTPTANDIDAGDTRTFSLTGNPAWLAVNSATGALSGTPGPNDVTTVNGIKLRVTDAGGLFAELTFSITVTNVNDAPTISGTPATATEDQFFQFVPTVVDPDSGDTLTFTITNPPPWLSSTTNGVYFGSPINAYVGKWEGIVIRVTDASGAFAELGPFAIEVVNVNDAPTISGTPTPAVAQGAAYSFTPTASDVDVGDTLTFSLTGNPAWLTVNTATGALSGTPANSDVATTSGIKLRVTDAAGLFAELTFSLTATNTNDAPTISGIPPDTVAQGAAYSFTPTASDIDTADTLTFSLTGNPAWLTVNSSTGDLSGTPANGDVATTNGIKLRVSDAAGLFAELTFSITVTNLNDAPTISGIPPTTVAEDTAYSFTPAASDMDTGDTLSFSLTGNPAWLTVNSATGALSGTPANADVATTSGIKLRVTDAAGLFAELTFSLTVTNVNDAPVITGQTALSTNEAIPLTLTLADLVVTDVDNDYPQGFTMTLSPGTGYTVSGATVTPDVGATGTLTVPVKVYDGGLDSNVFNVTITLTDNLTPDAPTLTGVSPAKVPAWSWSGNGGVGVFRFKVDNQDLSTGATITSATSHTAPLSDGSHTLYVSERNDNMEWSAAASLVIVVDNAQPTVTVEVPQNGSTMNGFAALSGTASDNVGLSRVELQVSRGGYYVNEFFGWSTTPHWFTAIGTTSYTFDSSFIALVSGNSYTVSARSIDHAGNVSPVVASDFTFDLRTTEQAYTTLTMEVSTKAMLAGATLEVTGKLTRLPDNGSDLSGRVVTVEVVHPDQTKTTYTATTSTAFGHYAVTGIDAFDVDGVYRVTALFGGDTGLFHASSQTENIVVGNTSGYALLVLGRLPGGEGQPSHNKTASRIYQKLIKRGFSASDIRYLNYDLTQPGANAVPTIANIKDAIESWAFSKMSTVNAPLHLIFVDHGMRETFFVDPDELTPAILANSLDILETKLTGAGINPEPRVVVMGACYSGSFVSALSKQGRIIVSSAAEDEESYRGPLEPDGVRSGEFFLDEFYTELERGQSVRSAFMAATEKVETFTRKGQELTNSVNRYFDDAVQHPQLDDNGDSRSTNLVSLGSDDGKVAGNVYLGTGVSYNVSSTSNGAEIVDVTPMTVVAGDISSATLWAVANDDSKVSSAWVEIRKPSVSLSPLGGTSQLSISLSKELLTREASGTHWSRNSNSFTEPGKYEVFYFVRDNATLEVSPMQRSIVYKAKEGNLVPVAFDLALPAHEAKVKTVGFLTWGTSADPEGFPVAYSLEIATDDQFANVVKRIDDIKTPFFAVESKFGLLDQTTYFWRVWAVDFYGGMTRSTTVRSFTTNNTNALLSGLLNGVIYDSVTGKTISGAAVESQDSGKTTSATGGYYLSSILSTSSALNVSAPGYKTVSVSNLQVASGSSSVVNIPLEPTTGSDNTPPVAGASQESGTYVSAFSLTLTCDDGTGSGCDQIFYTLNGSEPTANASVYALPLDIDTTTTVKFYAKDKAGNSSPVVVRNFTIQGVNQPPVLNPIDNRTGSEGALLSFQVGGSDPNGGSATITASPLPAGAIFDGALFSWTPGYAQADSYQLTFTISDGELSASQTITIDIADVNRQPVVEALSQASTTENAPVSFAVTASDPDGVIPSLTAKNLPTGATFEAGLFSWTPTYDQAGAYTVTFEAWDGVTTVTHDVSLSVANVNRSPALASIGVKAGSEGQNLSFTLSAADPDTGAELTYSAEGLPQGAVFVFNAFSWTPSFDQASVYTVTFTVSDGSLSASEAVQITVANVNRPPVIAAIDNKSANEGVMVEFDVTATDADSDTVTISAAGTPAGADFTNGHFSWTPSFVQAGSHSVTFTANDGTASTSQDITLTVTDVNRPPKLAALANQRTTVGTTLEITLAATDDADDTLAYYAANLSAGAALNGAAFTFTPTAGQEGKDFLLVFGVTDSGTPTYGDAQTVVISVGTVNAPPQVFELDPIAAGAGGTVDFTVNATDLDGDALSWDANNLPPGATFNPATRTLAWSGASEGDYRVYFTATDAGTPPKADTRWVSVNVGGVDSAPVLNPIGDRTVPVGATLSFKVTASDAEGDAINYSALMVPTGATFADQLFTFDTTGAAPGNYYVTFIATETAASALYDAQTVAITVGDVNRPPVVALIGPKKISENQTLTFPVRATDPDGDNLTYSLVNAPAGAALNGSVFTWATGYSSAGVYDVTFKVTDDSAGGALSGQETVTITVGEVNRAPVMGSLGDKSVTEGVELAFTVTATDPDGTTPTIGATGLPSGATFSGGEFKWTPAAGQAGTHTVNFTATDGSLSAGGQVTITVTAKPSSGGGGGGGGGGCFLDSLLR